MSRKLFTCAEQTFLGAIGARCIILVTWKNENCRHAFIGQRLEEKQENGQILNESVVFLDPQRTGLVANTDCSGYFDRILKKKCILCA